MKTSATIKDIVLSKGNNGFQVYPSTEELNALVAAIGNWSLDSQVTHALRGYGFGGDGYGIGYPGDVNDEWEYCEAGIELNADQILVSCGFDDEYHIVEEQVYLECLRQGLVLSGLYERADTIALFMHDHSYADQLVESNVDLCKYRFRNLTDILRSAGWEEANDIVPTNKYLCFGESTYKLYFENIRDDMRVFLRSNERQLQDLQKYPATAASLAYKTSLESIIDSVHQLFEYEKRRSQ